jgi:cation diffusion facilitator family transporter
LEVLAAQANGLALLATAGWIFNEARQRISSPTDVEGMGLLAIAAVATAGNLGIALLLGRNRGQSLNMRAAFLHKAMDVGGSMGALLAGVAVAGWGADWADPVVSVLIAALLVLVALRLLKDATHVLMEGAPQHIDPTEVHGALVSAEGVTSVHHLHLWSLASDVPALSAHIVLEDGVSMDDARLRRAELQSLLADRFGIHHATFEVERVKDLLPDATHRPEGVRAEGPPREEEPREGAPGPPVQRSEVDGRILLHDGSCDPGQIAAILKAARRSAPRRVIAVFQPHGYRRTQATRRELGESLSGADAVVLTDVYGDGEPPIPGVTGKLVVDALAEVAPAKRIVYLPRHSDVAPFLVLESRSGDLILFIGDGDIGAVDEQVRRLIPDTTNSGQEGSGGPRPAPNPS